MVAATAHLIRGISCFCLLCKINADGHCLGQITEYEGLQQWMINNVLTVWLAVVVYDAINSYLAVHWFFYDCVEIPLDLWSR